MVERKITLNQERLAYKRAVRMTLCAFFYKTEQEARELVEAWWQRMGHDAAYTTAIFLHDEPVNTAAALAGIDRVPSISTLGPEYERLIEASMPKRRDVQRQPPPPKNRQALQAQ
jgi:hypothetical protein